MARPVKDGLGYFPTDVDLFNDRKIKMLMARHGGDGLALYLYILCEIYRDKGYFLQVDEDFSDVAAHDLTVSFEKIGLMLKFLVDKSLFDDTLFIRDKILTSRSIQKRYQSAVGTRGAKRRIVVIERLWLLDPIETEGFIQLQPDTGKLENNHSCSGNNPDKSNNKPTKERKGNKRNKDRVSGGAPEVGRRLTKQAGIKTTDDGFSLASKEDAQLEQIIQRVQPEALQPGFWNLAITEYLRTMYYFLSITVNNQSIPRAKVRERMQRLDRENVQHVLDKLKTSGNIDNIQPYLIACLYNAPIDYDAFLNTDVIQNN